MLTTAESDTIGLAKRPFRERVNAPCKQTTRSGIRSGISTTANEAVYQNSLNTIQDAFRKEGEMADFVSVYFAGSVSKGGGYREEITGNSRCMSQLNHQYMVFGLGFTYGGPVSLSNDHGNFHLEPHAMLGSGYQGEGSFSTISEEGDTWLDRNKETWTTGFAAHSAVQNCFERIKACDFVFAHLIDGTEYGTLVEIGYATALGKPIYIVQNRETPPLQCILDSGNGPQNMDDRDELWFAKHVPGAHIIKVKENYEHLNREQSELHRALSHFIFGAEKVKRKPLSKSIRFAVLKRDNYTCQICGRNPKDDLIKLEVDHIYPVSLDGSDDLNNLQTSCVDCNRGKRDQLL